MTDHSLAPDIDDAKSSASSSYFSSRSSYTTSVSSLPTDATDTLTTESSLMLQWREDTETPPGLRSDLFILHHRRSSRELGQMERGRHRVYHHRCRSHCCKRATSRETYREQELTRDFFLIMTLCFVLACGLICMGRPLAFLSDMFVAR
ncbi:hypothetical protein D9757_001808 [Collybiopsis confluens]|uniref:Uncharacterized protein n=1 Tax=Collybiopsis confluens TaxID=2823264 RepID=A0A8H5HY66_9AGAR|nr:hypothetical protein D9757_001808 [Collybiopsis confluens]